MRIANLTSLALLFLASSCVADAPDSKTSSWDPQKPSKTQTVAFNDDVTSTAETSSVYKVKLETSKGDIVLEINPAWAPIGAAQFKAAVEDGVFDDARFFRAVEGFMVQFGIPGDPAKAAKWRDRKIKDDKVLESNTRGMISFATSGPNSRTSQVFINYGDNSFLNDMGFAPFGKVVEGLDILDALNTEYGEGAPRGRGPDQGRIQYEGNAYLNKDFPKLDFIKKATIIE